MRTVAQEWLPASPAQFSGLVPRIAAVLADLAVLVVYWAAVRYLPVAELLQVALTVAGPILYFPLAWARFGATIGMQLLGLRIVRDRDGTKIDIRVAIVRFVVFLPSVVLALVILGIALALPVVFDRRHRAVHDRLAGTVVVGRPYRGTSDPLLRWFW